MTTKIKANTMVDVEIDETLTAFEQRLRNGLEFYLIANTDRKYWEQNNKFRYRNAREVNHVIEKAFEPMYTKYPELTKFLDDSLVLLQNCTWVGMNVPWTSNPDHHIERVVDNVIEVYITEVYVTLRSSLITKELIHSTDRA
jgi:hypothetical protein